MTPAELDAVSKEIRELRKEIDKASAAIYERQRKLISLEWRISEHMEEMLRDSLPGAQAKAGEASGEFHSTSPGGT